MSYVAMHHAKQARTLSHAEIEALPHFKLHHRAGNEYSAACPFCDSDDDALLFWPDEGNYWCRRCHAQGWVDGEAQLDPARLAELESKREARERTDRERQQQAVSKMMAMGSKAEFYHAGADYDWWASKGLDREAVDRFKLGTRRPSVGDYGWRRETASHTIPYFRNGKLTNIQHRLEIDIAGKYRPEIADLGHQLFNVDRLSRQSELMARNEAVIVEGAIKAMVLELAGFRVIGIPSKSSVSVLLAELKEVLKPFDRVFVALDPDALDKARALAVGLGPKAIVSQLPDKPDDLLVLEHWTPEQLYKALAPKLMAARERRDRILAEAEAKRAGQAEDQTQRQAELKRRFDAGNKVAWLGDEEIDPKEVERRRHLYTNAQTWADEVARLWPDLDANEQKQIKLAENREARPASCGEYRKVLLPNGQVATRRWTCGICDECIKRGVWIYTRALDEMQGIARYEQGEPATLDDLTNDALDKNAPRENAPPLPMVQGDLSMVTVATDEERLKLARDLRREGVNYRTQPLVWNDEIRFDFLVNDDRGDPARLLLSDERLAAWVLGVENKRASGGLLPSLKNLQQRYRPALPYEVVMPELDDAGEPVDPDVFCLDLPDIGTTKNLPDVAIGFRVYDRESLQAALVEINDTQHRILGRRGDVNYGVYSKKKMYTRYSTLSLLVEDFNAWQAEIRQKKDLPPL